MLTSQERKEADYQELGELFAEFMRSLGSGKLSYKYGTLGDLYRTIDKNFLKLNQFYAESLSNHEGNF